MTLPLAEPRRQRQTPGTLAAVWRWSVLAHGPLMARLSSRWLPLVLVVALASAVSYALWLLLGGGDDPTATWSLVRGGAAGVVHLVLFFVLARVFRVREVAEIVDPLRHAVARRLRRG